MRPAGCLVLCLGALFIRGAEPAKSAAPPKGGELAEPAKTFERAMRALAGGDYAAAERGFRAVLRQQPRNVPALSNLGVIYGRTHRADQAIAVYRRALRVSPNDKAILLNLGLVYLRQEDHTRALPQFARVVALDPQHLQARQLLAVCRAYTGQLEPAIRDLEALRGASPKDEGILFLLGFAYLKNHDPEKAKAVFDQMFQAVPPARAHFVLGKAHYEATLFPQAEESFLEALRLDPNLPGVHVELGKVYISLRRNEDAARELELALKQDPGDADASYFLGGLLVQSARYQDALPYLERVRKVKPDFWAPYFYLGKAKLRLDQPAAAVELLKRAVDLNPYEASAYYQLGRALQACGRDEEARQALRRVRELRASALESVAIEDARVVGTR